MGGVILRRRRPEPGAAVEPEPLAPALPSARFGPGPAENSYIAILGGKGTGKSTLLEGLYRDVVGAGVPGVFVDKVGRFEHLGHRVGSVQEFLSYALPYLEAGRSWGSVVFTPGWRGRLPELWPVLYDVGGLFLAVDEVQTVGNAHGADKDFTELLASGRNAEVSVGVTARLPRELPGDLSGNVDLVYALRQPRPYYAEIVASEYFPELARADQMILRLPDHHYLWTRRESGAVALGRFNPYTASA